MVTTISTFTAARIRWEGQSARPATNCPTVPPESDHTGICTELLDIKEQSEGWPVAMDVFRGQTDRSARTETGDGGGKQRDGWEDDSHGLSSHARAQVGLAKGGVVRHESSLV